MDGDVDDFHKYFFSLIAKNLIFQPDLCRDYFHHLLKSNLKFLDKMSA